LSTVLIHLPCLCRVLSSFLFSIFCTSSPFPLLLQQPPHSTTMFLYVCKGLLTFHIYAVLFPSLPFSSFASAHLHPSISTLLSPPYLTGGWWRWALVRPDGVTPSQMVSVSASVNLPLHHKVQKFSSGTGSPGWSRQKGRKNGCLSVFLYLISKHAFVILTCLFLVQLPYTYSWLKLLTPSFCYNKPHIHY